MSNRKEKALIVFAKPPVAGLAKTRLIPALGENGAAEFHAKLLNLTLKNVVSENEWDTHLWCSENIVHPFFQTCVSGYSIKLHLQSEGDLGERMTHAMQYMLSQYEKVCIIGSDCPVLDRSKLRKVFAGLNSDKDVVVTPAEDGGYVLMAVRKELNADIFSGTQWGGRDVFQNTLKNIQGLKLNPVIQSTLWDIDTPEDLNRIQI